MSQTPYASGHENGNRKLTEAEYARANPSRARVLQEAERLITGDRNVSYGTPTQNFQNIADLWNVRFGHKLFGEEKFTAADIADAMILLKVARNIAQVKRDGYVDIAGYAGCGWEAHESATGPNAVTGVVQPDFIKNPAANDQRVQND